MKPEIEGVPPEDGLSGLSLTGIVTSVMTILVVVANWLRQRAERRSAQPVEDAERTAVIADQRLSAAISDGSRGVIELLRQQMQTMDAAHNDMRDRLEAERIKRQEAELEISRLKVRLDEMIAALTRETALREQAERMAHEQQVEIEHLRRRVQMLEEELRGAGIPVPPEQRR